MSRRTLIGTENKTEKREFINSKMEFAKLSDSETARMRKSFDTKMSELVIIRRRTAPYEWRKKDWIEYIIAVVSNFDPTKPHTTTASKIAEKYNVEERNGVKALVGTQAFHANKRPHYVAVEDYFDVLYDAHIETNHAARKKLQEHLQAKNIYMPSAAELLFLKLCKVCKDLNLQQIRGHTRRLPLRPRKNTMHHRGFVELLDMRKQPDGDYTCIMHYKEVATDCTFLRPLRSPHAADVAEELLQLFVLLGCPRILHSPTSKSFTQSVCQKIAVAWPGCTITCGEKTKPMRKIDKIEENLLKWMKRNRSNSWSVGVYVVAHRMNLTKKPVPGKPYRQTPFKSLLGFNPKKGLNTQGLKSLKYIEYEEDLRNTVVDFFDESSGSSLEEDESETDSDDCNEIGLKEVVGVKPELVKPPVKTYQKKPRCNTTEISMDNGMLIKLVGDTESDISTPQITACPVNTENESSNILIGLNKNKTTFVKTYSKSKIKPTIAKPKPQFTEATNSFVAAWYKEQPRSKHLLKQIQSWNSEVIDLPIHSPPKTETSFDLGTSDWTCEDFGEIPKSSHNDDDISCVKLESVDVTDDVPEAFVKDEWSASKTIKDEWSASKTIKDEWSASKTIKDEWSTSKTIKDIVLGFDLKVENQADNDASGDLIVIDF